MHVYLHTYVLAEKMLFSIYQRGNFELLLLCTFMYFSRLSSLMHFLLSINILPTKKGFFRIRSAKDNHSGEKSTL